MLDLPLEEIKLPPGFSIALYTDQPVPNARVIVRSEADNGGATIVYAGTTKAGVVSVELRGCW